MQSLKIVPNPDKKLINVLVRKNFTKNAHPQKSSLYEKYVLPCAYK